jgi:hypothetical protein
MPEELFNVLLLNLDFKEKQVENVFFNNSQGSFGLLSPFHYTVFLHISFKKCSQIFSLFQLSLQKTDIAVLCCAVWLKGAVWL